MYSSILHSLNEYLAETKHEKICKIGTAPESKQALKSLAEEVGQLATGSAARRVFAGWRVQAPPKTSHRSCLVELVRPPLSSHQQTSLITLGKRAEKIAHNENKAMKRATKKHAKKQPV